MTAGVAAHTKLLSHQSRCLLARDSGIHPVPRKPGIPAPIRAHCRRWYTGLTPVTCLPATGADFSGIRQCPHPLLGPGNHGGALANGNLVRNTRSPELHPADRKRR